MNGPRTSNTIAIFATLRHFYTEDPMRDKIVFFILGLILGAVLVTIVYFAMGFLFFAPVGIPQ